MNYKFLDMGWSLYFPSQKLPSIDKQDCLGKDFLGPWGELGTTKMSEVQVLTARKRSVSARDSELLDKTGAREDSQAKGDVHVSL